jgi:hypothetical protein
MDETRLALTRIPVLVAGIFRGTVPEQIPVTSTGMTGRITALAALHPIPTHHWH